MQHRKSRSRIVWLCALAVGVSVSCGQAQQDKPLATNGTPAQQSPVDRGQYLATVMDCNGCHTPFKNGEPDMTKRLSGHPESVGVKTPPKLPEGWAVAINDTNTEWAGPWGVSFTANLTSDQNTGLGIWTEEMFINAIRKGKHMATSRDILPPMPWRMQANLTDDDLKAIFAYLRTVPPITNHVPEAIPPPAR